MTVFQVYEYTGDKTTQDVVEVTNHTVTPFRPEEQESFKLYVYPEYGLAFLESEQHFTEDSFWEEYNLTRFIPSRDEVRQFLESADGVERVDTLSMDGRVTEYAAVDDVSSSEPVDFTKVTVGGICVEYTPSHRLSIETDSPGEVLDWFGRIFGE